MVCSIFVSDAMVAVKLAMGTARVNPQCECGRIGIFHAREIGGSDAHARNAATT